MCSDRNKLFLRISGIRGRGDPEDMSQKTEDQRKGKETTEGLESIAWTEGQVDWRAGKAEKLKPGAENSRSTAWSTD